MRLSAAVLLLTVPTLSFTQARAVPVPSHFGSSGADRTAIEALLGLYTKAVSNKDQALFETLLLNRDIPFSFVGSATGALAADRGTQHYEAFRKGVFDGPAFTQRFQDIHIEQDGPLAAVSLVFVNSSPGKSSWGWKTLQLLEVGGRWKIASEFYTGHAG